MTANTKIEWADHTFNPWVGCTKVSPGCDHCYAEGMMDKRLHKVQWGPGSPRQRTSVANWREPLRWNAAADAFHKLHGRRQRVFCASLADVFDNEVPVQWRDDLFALIEATPNLDWLLLTKRIGNVGNMLPVPFDFDKLYPNVWLGATIVNQLEADRDIPKLLATPAAKRFLSMEPLLGAVNLTDISDGHADSSIPREFWDEDIDTEDSPPAVGHNALTGERWQHFGSWSETDKAVDWVIAGGESGPNARPMHPDWVRSLRDQCAAAGVQFLFKQWGEWTPGENVERKHGTIHTAKWWNNEWAFDMENLARTDGHIDDEPDVYRVGKKDAGRLLDGIEHNGFPK